MNFQPGCPHTNVPSPDAHLGFRDLLATGVLDPDGQGHLSLVRPPPPPPSCSLISLGSYLEPSARNTIIFDTFVHLPGRWLEILQVHRRWNQHILHQPHGAGRVCYCRLFCLERRAWFQEPSHFTCCDFLTCALLGHSPCLFHRSGGRIDFCTVEHGNGRYHQCVLFNRRGGLPLLHSAFGREGAPC